jgi:hypothetical protein
MAARVAAAALVTATMFAALWAGPGASASGSRMQSLASGSSKHAKVKYYIVPQPGHGPVVALYGIAVRTLGNSHRYIEIFNLNKGRLQPNGGRLENPHTIDPGWILRLPADASGPGVNLGRLPGPRKSATSPASQRSSRPAPGGAEAAISQVKSTGPNTALVAGGALAVLLIAGLAFGLSRRLAGATVRRKHSYTRAPVPRDSVGADAVMTTSPDIHAVNPRWPGNDHPSWPGTDYPSQPGTAYSSGPAADPRPTSADHPSFPGADPHFASADYPGFPGADHPSFPGADPHFASADYPGFPGADHPSFPGADPHFASADYPGFPGADHPSFPGADPHFASADYPGFPGADRPSFPRAVGRSAGPWRDSPPQPHYAFGGAQLQVVLTETPPASWPGATGIGARPAEMLQPAGQEAAQAAQLADTVRREAGEFRNARSLWLAGRILSGAENQAAEIRQEAYDHCAVLREAVEQEAAAAKQQAAAMRAAAEAQAAELLTAARTMSSELGRVAAYVTENLTSPGQPAAKPSARPDAKPVGRPATKPNGRQVKAMRKMVIALVAVFLVGAISGATEIGLHGYKFFVFRANGAGASLTGPKEDQGPGQPDAPGTHHKANASKSHGKPSGNPSSKPRKSS